MLRTFRLRYTDGDPVADADLVLWRHGTGYDTTTDGQGNAQLDFPENWVDRVDIDGQTVRRDWDIGNKADLTYESFKIPKPGELRPEDQDSGSEDQRRRGVVGRYFYADGTAASGARSVAIDFANGQRASSEDRGGYARDDGQFFVPTNNSYQDGWRPTHFYVNHEEISSKAIAQAKDGSVTLVLPRYMGSGGTSGGLITGRVVDPDGASAIGVKVVGELGGWLRSGGGTTYTDNKGKFVLPFDGGIELKQIYVDGHEPLSVERIGKGGQPLALRSTELQAGMFNLRIVRKKRFLGFF
jgi:hypothetical protein